MKPRPTSATPTRGAVIAMAMTGLLTPPPLLGTDEMPFDATADWGVGVVVVVATTMVVVVALSLAGGMVVVMTALLVTKEVKVAVGDSVGIPAVLGVSASAHTSANGRARKRTYFVTGGVT